MVCLVFQERSGVFLYMPMLMGAGVFVLFILGAAQEMGLGMGMGMGRVLRESGG